MRKYLLLPTLALLLAACGNEEQPATEQPTADQQEQGAEVVENEEDITTADPVEFANINSDKTIYESGFMDLQILSRYANEDTDEDGFNHVSFEGYDYKFAVLVVSINEGDPDIALMGETENNTDDAVAFNSNVEVITSNGDQTESYDAVGESEPGVKKKAFITADLDYDVPDSLDMTLQPPLKKISEDEFEEGHYGEPKTFKFTKQ